MISLWRSGKEQEEVLQAPAAHGEAAVFSHEGAQGCRDAACGENPHQSWWMAETGL